MQRSFPGVEDRASAWFCSCDKKATSCGLSLQIDLFKNSMIASESSLRVFLHGSRLTNSDGVDGRNFSVSRIAPFIDQEICPGDAQYLVKDWDVPWDPKMAQMS